MTDSIKSAETLNIKYSPKIISGRKNLKQATEYFSRGKENFTNVSARKVK